MSRLMITSDLHLGHKNIHKFRTQFDSAEDHHQAIFDNFASNINKRDSVILLGDIAFDAYWLKQIEKINCIKKTLILGNHDTEHCSMGHLMMTFDAIHSMYSKRNMWFTHCPVHSDHFRGKDLNVHGHLHNEVVCSSYAGSYEVDQKYFNACVEHTDYKPISFSEILERTKGSGLYD